MLTIVTSFYRSEKYIAKYVDNLRSVVDYLKNKIDFEVLVVANEPSKKEIDAFQLVKNEPWLKLVEVPRETLYASWNRGVEMSRGTAITFWNVDDNRRPEAMIVGERLINDGADIVLFPFTIYWYLSLFGLQLPLKKRIVIPEDYDREKFTSGMVCGPFFIFAKELFYKVGPFDEQFKIVGDFDWCVRAAKITDKFRISKINAGEFRVDGTGLSAGSKHRKKLENSIVFKRHTIPISVEDILPKEIDEFKIDKILHNGILKKY